ncbi:hypothetical protein D3C78_1637360 [compost metagenome]
MTQAIHDHIGHRLHVGRILALGFPVNGAGQARDRIVQRRGTRRVNGLDLGRGNGFDLGSRCGRFILGGLLFQHLGLVLRRFLFLLLIRSRYRAGEQCEGEAGGDPVEAHGRCRSVSGSIQSSSEMISPTPLHSG